MLVLVLVLELPEGATDLMGAADAVVDAADHVHDHAHHARTFGNAHVHVVHEVSGLHPLQLP